jgi:hypothetical protein
LRFIQRKGKHKNITDIISQVFCLIRKERRIKIFVEICVVSFLSRWGFVFQEKKRKKSLNFLENYELFWNLD